MTACSTNSVLEEVKGIESTDPLIFTSQEQDTEQGSGTRASNPSTPLTSDFMVSTYKAFALPNQQLVMDKYKVEYKTSGTAPDGTARPYWDYTKVPGQYERFWDYSNYPYRFNAVTPCPASAASIVLNDKQLTINSPYRMQQCADGIITPADAEAEKYLVAQVQRDPDGKDYDLMKCGGRWPINVDKNTLNRSVALPFHHLNSKVRFGIYSTLPWTSHEMLYIKNLVIKVASQGFVTQALGYNAVGTDGDYSWYRGMGHSGFTGISSATGTGLELLSFTGGQSVEGNDLTMHQGKSSAYWLMCEDGIMQLPQEGVMMTVSLELYRQDDNTEPYETFTDVPIKIDNDDETVTYTFDWKSGYMYTYYLNIGGIDDKLELTFTAQLVPWDLIGSTDINVGL